MSKTQANSLMLSTKDRLIQTALELIWRDSYSSISVDEICRSAHVQKGSFYHYFPSKADLALAAIDHEAKRMIDRHNDIFSPIRPPLERFERMIDFIYEDQADIQNRYGCVCGCPFAGIAMELIRLDIKFEKKINQIWNTKILYYESALKDLMAQNLLDKSVNIRSRAEDIAGFIIGQLMVARIKNDISFLKTDFRDSFFRLIGIDIKDKE